MRIYMIIIWLRRCRWAIYILFYNPQTSSPPTFFQQFHTYQTHPNRLLKMQLSSLLVLLTGLTLTTANPLAPFAPLTCGKNGRSFYPLPQPPKTKVVLTLDRNLFSRQRRSKSVTLNMLRKRRAQMSSQYSEWVTPLPSSWKIVYWFYRAALKWTCGPKRGPWIRGCRLHTIQTQYLSTSQPSSISLSILPYLYRNTEVHVA